MLATHFPPQALASGLHYRSHGRFCASRDYPLGTRLDVEYRRVTRRHHRRRIHRYVLRGVLVADICGIHGRLDFPNGTYRDFLTSRGADDGRAPVRVVGVHTRRHRRHH